MQNVISKPLPSQITEANEEELVRQIRNKLDSLFDDVKYFVKCVQFRRFFGPVETIIQCQGKAVPESIWFYLRNVNSVTCSICYADCKRRNPNGVCPSDCSKPLIEVSFIRI